MSTPRIPTPTMGADTCGVGQEESCLRVYPQGHAGSWKHGGYHYSFSATRATIILHDESDDQYDAK